MFKKLEQIKLTTQHFVPYGMLKFFLREKKTNYML